MPTGGIEPPSREIPCHAPALEAVKTDVGDAPVVALSPYCPTTSSFQILNIGGWNPQIQQSLNQSVMIPLPLLPTVVSAPNELSWPVIVELSVSYVGSPESEVERATRTFWASKSSARA